MRAAIEDAGFTVDSAELTMAPKTTIEVADESQAKKILRLIDSSRTTTTCRRSTPTSTSRSGCSKKSPRSFAPMSSAASGGRSHRSRK